MTLGAYPVDARVPELSPLPLPITRVRVSVDSQNGTCRRCTRFARLHRWTLGFSTFLLHRFLVPVLLQIQIRIQINKNTVERSYSFGT